MRKSISRRSLVVGRWPKNARVIGVLLPVIALSALALQPPDAAYVKDFDKWKAELVDDLKQNWLPLAGLFWLKPGDNVFGSGSDNPIVLPAGPAKAGRFIRQGDDVSVELAGS